MAALTTVATRSTRLPSAVLRALGRSEDAPAEISSLCEQLDAAYQRANSNLPDNPDLPFENDDLVLSHLDRLEEPPSLIALRREFQARLPKGDLPDIFLEVCTRTDLADRFTHVNERGEGHGIGLPYVRRVARDHGGDLALEDSDDLGGARAVLELPLADGTAGDAAVHRVRDEAALRALPPSNVRT